MMTFIKNLCDKKARKKYLRYYLYDPFWGSLDYIAHYALRYMPIDLNAKIGSFLGEIAGQYRFTKENARVLKNLDILCPQLNKTEKESIAKSMWQHIGKAMAEYSLMDKIFNAGRISVENDDKYLKPLIEQNKAIIFVSTHTGNWEIYGNYVIDYGIDLMCLYKPPRNRFSNRIAQKARNRMGGVIQLVDTNAPNAMRLVCKHLSSKKALWLAIDEVKNAQVIVPRFGRDISFKDTNAAYAVRLAQRYSATIVPVWTKRNENNRLTISVGEPFEIENNETAANEALLKLNNLVEIWLKENLGQWYMLHELRL